MAVQRNKIKRWIREIFNKNLLKNGYVVVVRSGFLETGFKNISSDFIELHGDRHFMDDPAVITGLGTMGQYRIALIGQQKGRNTKENLYRNFGMMRPEGYRKAMRIMKLAEKFNLPVITLMDTIGAYPGIGAEERGQGEAIARNLMEMSSLRVPIVSLSLIHI